MIASTTKGPLNFISCRINLLWHFHFTNMYRITIVEKNIPKNNIAVPIFSSLRSCTINFQLSQTNMSNLTYTLLVAMCMRKRLVLPISWIRRVSALTASFTSGSSWSTPSMTGVTWVFRLGLKTKARTENPAPWAYAAYNRGRIY